MSGYVMSAEEKLSYLMPSKREQEFNSRFMVDRNLDCLEVIIVNSGTELLLNEDPAEYRCKKCGGHCGGCDHAQFRKY